VWLQLKKNWYNLSKYWHFVQFRANSKKLKKGLGHLGVNVLRQYCWGTVFFRCPVHPRDWFLVIHRTHNVRVDVEGLTEIAVLKFSASKLGFIVIVALRILHLLWKLSVCKLISCVLRALRLRSVWMCSEDRLFRLMILSPVTSAGLSCNRTRKFRDGSGQFCPILIICLLSTILPLWSINSPVLCSRKYIYCLCWAESFLPSSGASAALSLLHLSESVLVACMVSCLTFPMTAKFSDFKLII